MKNYYQQNGRLGKYCFIQLVEFNLLSVMCLCGACARLRRRVHIFLRQNVNCQRLMIRPLSTYISPPRCSDNNRAFTRVAHMGKQAKSINKTFIKSWHHHQLVWNKPTAGCTLMLTFLHSAQSLTLAHARRHQLVRQIPSGGRALERSRAIQTPVPSRPVPLPVESARPASSHSRCVSFR